MRSCDGDLIKLSYTYSHIIDKLSTMSVVKSMTNSGMPFNTEQQCVDGILEFEQRRRKLLLVVLVKAENISRCCKYVAELNCNPIFLQKTQLQKARHILFMDLPKTIGECVRFIVSSTRVEFYYSADEVIRFARFFHSRIYKY